MKDLALGVTLKIIFNLHSNMDRFESNDVKCLEKCVDYLHSNMDRFERSCCPIPRAVRANLHSNMDRFESPFKSFTDSSGNKIYIPIWIDLKEVFHQRSAYRIDIYIPIWIDLKALDWSDESET